MSKRTLGLAALLLAAACTASIGCGGEVIGIGNSGNHIGTVGVLEDVAAALAASPATPQVTDAMISEVFEAIAERATAGDAEAALVVLSVARLQQEAKDGP